MTSSLQTEVEIFLKSEENTYEFTISKSEENKITLSSDYFKFTITQKEKGIFEIDTKEEEMEFWCEEVNNYCEQGKKEISDVLIKATDSYTEILMVEDEPIEEDFNEGFEEDDYDIPIELDAKYEVTDTGPPISQIPKYELSMKEEEKLKKQFDTKRCPNKLAVNRLMKDYVELCNTDHSKLGFSAAPIKNDLFLWEIKFFDFDESVCPDCKNFY